MNLRSAIMPQWNELPILTIGKIFEYLEQKDRLNASSTCKYWRSAVFQRRFFPNFTCRLHVDNEKQCIFFRKTICHMTSELVIIFDFFNIYHIEKIRRILFRAFRCDNIEGYRFQTNSVGPIQPGHISNEGDLVDIQHIFLEPLRLILRRKNPGVKILDFGALESLTIYSKELIQLLGKPEKLLQLTLASIKYNPNNYSIITIENSLIHKLSQLQVLSLDYDTVNEELLEAMHVLPLKKLLICIHGLRRNQAGISDMAWAQFSAVFPDIQLIITLLYTYTAAEVLQVRILRPNMPITHLRVLFCNFMNMDALDWMSVNNNSTLKSVQWIDSAYKNTPRNCEFFLRAGQDPFVMMAWRCKQLEEIVIHGYVLDPHNIVGISRLRGRTLKKLDVSMLDSTLTECNMESFLEEINTLLGRKWEPQRLNNLHPALGYIPVSDDVRDDFVFDLIRSDIYN